jgi:hypothetical protein
MPCAPEGAAGIEEEYNSLVRFILTTKETQVKIGYVYQV